MVLHWFIQAAGLRDLARDCEVFLATAYSYLHKAINVIAERAPGPIKPLQRRQETSKLYVPGQDLDTHQCSTRQNPR